MKAVSFNTKGYDDLIDFIKAYAIIWVLIGHFFPATQYLLYPILGGVQVPLFITVQAFHFMKKSNPVLNVWRVFTRVLLPFVYVQLFIVLLLYCKSSFYCLQSILMYFPEHGGYGQGDYFPVIYFQIALLLPLFFKITKKIENSWCNMIFYIVICEGLEILCSIIHIPDDIYRYLAFRYIFLLYFGWKWAKEGIKIDTPTIILSIISLLSIVYFNYLNGTCEPLFLDTTWKYHRWPCYFFTAEVLVYGLCCLWRYLKCKEAIVKVIQWLSKCSYDIFLAQMVAYVLFPKDVFDFLPSVAAWMLRFVIATSFSLIFGAFIHYFLSVITPQVKE